MNFLQREVIQKEIFEQVKLRDMAKGWQTIPYYARQYKDACDRIKLLIEDM